MLTTQRLMRRLTQHGVVTLTCIPAANPESNTEVWRASLNVGGNELVSAWGFSGRQAVTALDRKAWPALAAARNHNVINLTNPTETA